MLNVIRAKNAAEALTALDFMSKRSARVVAKTVRSALNNLSQKIGKKITPQEAWVARCLVNQGPFMKRLHTGSMGRAMPYKHRTCHLTVVVSDKPKRSNED